MDLMPWMKAPPAASLDWLIKEPASVYHAKAKDFLGSHLLADFRYSPSLYRRRRAGQTTEKDAEAFALGRAAHTLTLEGDEAYAAEYAIGGPINEKTGKPYGTNTKAYEEWEASVGKPVLSLKEDALVRELRAAVRRQEFACELLSVGVAEGVLRAVYCGERCQVRPDWMNPEKGIVDLKTCSNLAYFESDAKKYGYIHQGAFYRGVIAAHTGTIFPVHIIAVEKQEPFRCGVWRLGDGALGIAQQENQEAIARLQKCRERNEWPTLYEGHRVLDSIF